MPKAFIDNYMRLMQRVNICSVMTDSRPFLHNTFLEFVRICAFLFVHPPLEDWPQGLNGIKVWGVSWPWTQNINVLFPEPLGCHFCLLARCSIMLEKALFITKLFLDGWEKLLSEDLLVPFLSHGCVLRQNCEWDHSLGWEATPHMNGIRMLYCWHDTGLMVALTLSSRDKLFFRMP